MNVKYIIYVVFLVVSQPGFSQVSDTEDVLLQSFANGSEVMFNNSSYKLIPKGKVNTTDILDLNDQNILWSNQIGGYDVIIEAIPGRTIFQKTEDSTPNDFQLAYNEVTRKIAVVTGNIIVNLNGDNDAAAIASDYNLILTYDFPGIHRAFFKIDNQSELTGKLKVLNADYRVIEAYLEIIENFQRAQ